MVVYVYCTRPSCTNPENTISDEHLNALSPTETRCANCGMPLILRGHFVALERLGGGGFGRTFKAQDILRANDQRVSRTIRVIKQLHPINHPGQVLTPSMLEYIEDRFREEANILEELRHQQIPRFWDYFYEEVEENTGAVQRFFYLVQDYIEGQNLDHELQQRGRFSEDEVINILKEILNILQYIHNYNGTNGVIHRDIKPANIMRCRNDGRLYLIDFGAVRQIVQGLPVDTTSIVLDARFAPPEQSRGERLSSASDLYALATTCLCLLTGHRNPNQLLFNSTLQQHLQVKDRHFAEALDKMLQYEPEARPQSAQEVLDILSGEEGEYPPPKPPNDSTKKPIIDKLSWLRKFLDRVQGLPKLWRSLIGFSLPFFLGIAIAVTVNFIITPKPPAPPPPDAEYFSRGEEALIPDNNTSPECSTAYGYKKQGIEAFKNKDFTQAATSFNQAKLQFKQAAQTTQCEVDPETIIYEYNAKVAQTPSNRILPTIAVVIPGYSNNRYIALELLRGVAQSLNADEPLFQVIIAQENIDGDRIKTETIATYISKNDIPGDSDFNQSKIIGVVGHYTSINTWKAGEIYGGNQLNETDKIALISPTSTAIRKTDHTDQSKDLNPYVFRTASNDAIAVGDLVKYILEKSLSKTMIVYDPYDKYTDSLKREFDIHLLRNRGKFKNEYNCNFKTESADICILKAEAGTVDTILLFSSPKHLDISQQIIRLGNQKYQILGGDVLYDQEILNLKQAANNMVIGVFSHIKNANTQFTQKAIELGWINSITWRSMSAYDAAQVFIKALSANSKPTRLNIYATLKNPNFSASGATNAEVSFQPDGDRKLVKGVGVLVKVKEITPDKYGFELEQTPERNNP
jgi:serine/threonine-protein kinase